MDENNTNFKCQLCERTFDDLDFLNLHLRVAHNRKNRVGNSILKVAKLNCETCSKSFSTNGMLSRHVESKICQKSFQKMPEKPIIPQIKCSSCENSFWDTYTFKKHYESAHPKQLKCDICDDTFRTKSNLVSHKKLHKKESTHTGTVFESEIKIEESTAINLKNGVTNILSVSKFNCDICGKSFSTNGMLSRHVETKICQKSFVKEPEKPMLPQSKCNSCQNSYWDSYTLKKHYEIVHLKLKEHKCDICEMSFGTKGNLVLHTNTHKRELSDNLKDKENIFDSHIKIEENTDNDDNSSRHVESNICKKSFEKVPEKQNLQKLRCDRCGNSFRDNYTLKKHYDYVHLKLKQLKCDICKIGFATKNSLITHIKVHRKEYPDLLRNVENLDESEIKIKECNVNKFAKKQAYFDGKNVPFHEVNKMKDTTKTKEESIFECNECDKEFTMKYSLKLHHQTVHLKIKKFVCDSCNMSFGYKHHLKRHHNSVHLKLKPYKCASCDNCYVEKSDLKIHMKVHDKKESGNKCDLCDKTFLSNRFMKYHKTSVHKESQHEEAEITEIDDTNEDLVETSENMPILDQ